MAVYKPTYCYPFSDNFDARPLRSGGDLTYVPKFLTCKLETSNKDVTGYAVRLLNDAGEQLFPVNNGEKIVSPIEELQNDFCGYEEGGTNSGKNGTYLKIPFFVPHSQSGKHASFNSLYFGATDFKVDRVISTGTTGGDISFEFAGVGDINNWTQENDETYTYQYTTENVSIDGEKLQEGDIVLVHNEGIYKVEKKENGTIGTDSYNIQIKLRNITSDTKKNALIMKGDVLKNTLFKDGSIYLANNQTQITWWYYNTNKTITSIPETQNNKFPTGNGQCFYWEVTLYQGNHSNLNGSAPEKADYTSIDNRWLDMKMASGKILGTTPERLQLSDIQGKELLPSAGANNTLILQNKYVALGQASNQIISSNRVAIQTYDNARGHAYPVTDGLTVSDVDNNNYCQFFKYSNSESDIKDQDIVAYAMGANCPFYFNWATTDESSNAHWALEAENESTTEPSWTGISVINRYIVLKDSDGNAISAHVSVGAEILFVNQNAPKQNGIYVFNETTLLEPEGTAKVKKYTLVRSASYSSWGNYIGKILYIQKADNNGIAIPNTNVETGAIAGNFQLWNINSTSSGSSPLLFYSEKPIILFPQFIGEHTLYGHTKAEPLNPTEDAVINFYLSSTGVKTSFDGAYPYIGAKYFCEWTCKNVTYKGIYQVQKIEDSGNDKFFVTLNKNTDITLKDGITFYFEQGIEYGKQSYVYNSSKTPLLTKTYAPYTAKLLKNSSNRTYISPYINIERDMKLKLLYGKQVTFTEAQQQDLTPTEWIPINKVNTTLFYITHGDLQTALSSYDTADKSIPYHYDVMSYFIASDQNPFNDHTDPYLELYTNGDQWSGLQRQMLFTPVPTPVSKAGERYGVTGIYGYGARIPIGNSTFDCTKKSNATASITIEFTTPSILNPGRRYFLFGNYYLQNDNTNKENSISVEIRDDWGEGSAGIHRLCIWRQYGLDFSRKWIDTYPFKANTDYKLSVTFNYIYQENQPQVTIKATTIGGEGESGTQLDCNTFEDLVCQNYLGSDCPKRTLGIFGDYRSSKDFQSLFGGMTYPSVTIKRIYTDIGPEKTYFPCVLASNKAIGLSGFNGSIPLSTEPTQQTPFGFYSNEYLSGTVLPKTSEDKYYPSDYILGRSSSLMADYKQFLNGSWESYRWRLLDMDDKVLQDTGRKYDKQIATTFYGLRIKKNNLISYKVNLQIEDEFRNLIDKTWIFRKYTDDVSPIENMEFNAKYEKQTQSVLLDFNLSSQNDENQIQKYSIYRREIQVRQDLRKRREIDVSYDQEKNKYYAYVPNTDPSGTIPLSVEKNWLCFSKDDNEECYYYESAGTSDASQIVPVAAAQVYRGEWEPVALLRDIEHNSFRDYNIDNNKNYEYVIYPQETAITTDYETTQTFANQSGICWYDDYGEKQSGVENYGIATEAKKETSQFTGAPISTCWNWWGLVDLIPTDNEVDAPVLRKTYTADFDNIWLFKYSLETGGQTQNITRNENQTLGKFPAFGFGQSNYISGSVNALLGSEIVLCSKAKYLERSPKNRVDLSTSNERIEMLEKWRDLVNSTHPKLLKDIKGQTWVVQITSSNNTPQNFYYNQPDTISFEWKQVDTTTGMIITSDNTVIDTEIINAANRTYGAPLFGSNAQTITNDNNQVAIKEYSININLNGLTADTENPTTIKDDGKPVVLNFTVSDRLHFTFPTSVSTIYGATVVCEPNIYYTGGTLTLSNPIRNVTGSLAANEKPQVVKGDILKINMDGQLKKYRVVSINNNIAKMLSLWDDGNGYTYLSDGVHEYLENWYNSLRPTEKSALVNIRHSDEYYYTNATGNPSWTLYSGNTKPGTTAYNISYQKKTVEQEDCVYLLDVDDVISYISDTSVGDGQLQNYNIWKMFWGDEVSHGEGIWLRSIQANATWRFLVNGWYGSLSTMDVSFQYRVRPSFTIDLSQIEFIIEKKKIDTPTDLSVVSSTTVTFTADNEAKTYELFLNGQSIGTLSSNSSISDEAIVDDVFVDTE